jgi:hypothetical protein
MPQELEVVYEVETGKPVYMHSVDAAEACNLGDYTRLPPEGHPVPEQELAAAMAQSRGLNTTTHPELQTPEQRAETRRLANAATMPVVSVPVGSPVVLTQGTAPTAPSATQQQAARRTGSQAPVAPEEKK